MFLCCIPRCRGPGPRNPCCGRLAQWRGRWASPHPRRTWCSYQSKARGQDKSAPALAQHSGLGIASILHMHRPPTPDYLCVVEQWTNLSPAQEPPSAAFPSKHKPREVALSPSVLVTAQVEAWGPPEAHLPVGAVGPDGSACAGAETRPESALAPDLGAGAPPQSPDLPPEAPLELCLPLADEQVVEEALGTATPSVTELLPVVALAGENAAKEALEPWVWGAAEPEPSVSPAAARDAAGAAEAALAPPPAPAPEVPPAPPPVQDPSLPSPMIVYYSVLIPVFLMFCSMFTALLNKK
nr:nematocyst expressed protein 3-like isoform X4 [Oryctolagus cuniculus]